MLALSITSPVPQGRVNAMVPITAIIIIRFLISGSNLFKVIHTQVYDRIIPWGGFQNVKEM
jgi:hypothetical protein